MKTQSKLISHFAVVALACGSLCVSASLRAQSSATSSTPSDALTTPGPDANKKEAPYTVTTPAPTPTPTPKK